MKKNLKICLVASSGGHLEELKRLSNLCVNQGLCDYFDCFYMTEKTNNLKKDINYYFVSQINRKEFFFIFKFIILIIKSIFIFLKEKPDYVISTGALATYPICRIAKFFKKKVIYIESFARINDLSLTGKKLYNHADLFFVQWEELVSKYPKAIYVGSLF